MLLLLLAAASAAAEPSTQSQSMKQASNLTPIQIPAGPALTQQIAQADAELFALFFSGSCDVPRLRGMLAQGAEFYHDRKGLASIEEFVADYRKDCESRVDPKAPIVRRELMGGSLSVSAIGNRGAFQTGEHQFYVREGESIAERLASRRRFAIFWVLGDDGKWRLSRVFDYRSPSAR